MPDIRTAAPARLSAYPVDDSTVGVGASADRLDGVHGGSGRIAATVKTLGTPNQPVRRRVQLIDERSGLVVRETWSDAATGAYAFNDIHPGASYTVVAYDHTGYYRAVIADNLKAST
jgi:hypothetical protein